MPELRAALADQFEDQSQQELAVTTGMWVFLATEVMFFGGLFLAYAVFRFTYSSAFAQAGAESNVLIGTVNTAILLTSSLSIAIATLHAKTGKLRSVKWLLGITCALGLVFLTLKGIEYSHHISDHLFPGSTFQHGRSGPFQMFWWLYFIMTGLHAIHVIIGVAVIGSLIAQKKWMNTNSITAAALYWHFVDGVWVFLYPLFYLIHR